MESCSSELRIMGLRASISPHFFFESSLSTHQQTQQSFGISRKIRNTCDHSFLCMGLSVENFTPSTSMKCIVLGYLEVHERWQVAEYFLEIQVPQIDDPACPKVLCRCPGHQRRSYCN